MHEDACITTDLVEAFQKDFILVRALLLSTGHCLLPMSGCGAHRALELHVLPVAVARVASTSCAWNVTAVPWCGPCGSEVKQLVGYCA